MEQQPPQQQQQQPVPQQQGQQTVPQQQGQQPMQPQQGTASNQNNHATASLYVGDLEQNVTESMLFEMFKQIGPVASIRVCRDNGTRRSLGYAYVNFHRIEDAERALDTLNYTKIGNKACRIMWSQRDPSLRKSGVGNIFIKNLHPEIQSADLYDNFAQFGTILSCKVATDSDGKSKGFGFVHFESPEAAQNAIDEINGMEIESKIVSVHHFKSKKQRIPGEVVLKFTNVYVKFLDTSVTEKELGEYFSQCGKVTSVAIPLNNENVSCGFGFVNFELPESARKAVSTLNNVKFKGKTLYVARAQTKSERVEQLRKEFEQRKIQYQESNLYIKNLDDTIDDKKLHEVFSPYGTIVSAKVMLDGNVSKGFGFVCYSTPEEAHTAVQELNGHMLQKKPLYVAFAQRKEVRKAQLQAQYAQKQNAKMMIPNQQLSFGMHNQPPFPMHPGFPNAPYNRMFQRSNWGMHQPQSVSMAPFPRPHIIRDAPINRVPIQTQRQPQPQQPQQQPIHQQQTGLSAVISSLPKMTAQQRKRAIGDHLYQKITQYFQINVEAPRADPGKITGMLLESLDEQELLNLAEAPQELKKRIEEAVDVLRQHQSNDNQQN